MSERRKEDPIVGALRGALGGSDRESRDGSQDPIVRGMGDLLGTSGGQAGPRDSEREARIVLGFLLLVVGLALSPPALLAAWGLMAARVERWLLWRAAAGGLALVVLFYLVGLLDATWAAGWRQAAAAPGGLLLNAGEALAAATPQLFYGWALLLPLAPLLAVVLDLVGDKRPGEEERARMRSAERRAQRTERRATRRLGDASATAVTATAGEEEGIVLGERLAGERALPVKGRAAVLPFAAIRQSVLCAGAPGSGKTETAMRLCWALAKALPDAAIAYIDGKGDRQAAERFCGLMADAGRTARVWPMEPFDAWRGDGWAVYYRVLELGQYPTSGEAFHYRSLAMSALRLAVAEHPEGPPRSSGGLLERLDPEKLKAAHGPSVEAELSGAQVADVRRRYAGVFGPMRGAADGDWSFEDAGAAYFMVERQRMGKEAQAAARFLFEDFGHFFSERKARERPCLLVVDELSALAEEGGLASRIEQARGFATGLVLCPQSAAGMGPEEEARRIRDAVGLTILHRVNDPELIASAAGTRMGLEYSQHYEAGRSTGEGSARLQHQSAIDLNEARALRPGVAFLISHGRTMKAHMAQAPAARAELPRPRRLLRDQGRHDGDEPGAPRELPY